MNESEREKTQIAVSGNIGAGKSSLVQALSQHYHWHAVYEPSDENPYLQDFYHDMQRWAFPTQVYFLTSRFKQAIALQKVARSIVQDRTIYEDAHIFALNLYQSGFLQERDYQNYLGLYHAMVNFVAQPDLLIYLKARVHTLVERIGKRATSDKKRRYETTISEEYLTNLNLLYEQWIQKFEVCKVLTVDIDTTDILGNKNNFKQLTDRIDLAVKTQFP
jgi:deoxyadenosine/deoxycytidine kinase